MQTPPWLYRRKTIRATSGNCWTWPLIFKIKTYCLADALPGLAAAEHAAECATLNLQRVGALHRDRGVVIAAAVRIVNLAGPFRALWLHADQDFRAGLHRIAAEVLTAFLDANIALVFFGGPDTERRGRSSGNRSRRRCDGCDRDGRRGDWCDGHRSCS